MMTTYLDMVTTSWSSSCLIGMLQKKNTEDKFRPRRIRVQVHRAWWKGTEVPESRVDLLVIEQHHGDCPRHYAHNTKVKHSHTEGTKVIHNKVHSPTLTRHS